MVGDGRGLKISTALMTALVTLVLAFLALRWWAGRGQPLPPASFTVAGLLAVLGAAQFLVARRIRRGVTGASTRRLDPLWGHRMLLIGQAAALTGAVVVGWYLALGGVLLPDVDAGSVRRAALAALAMAGGAIVLAAGGFGIQAACRIDPPDTAGEDWPDDGDGWADTHRSP